jgi:hypothetical protein
MRLCQDFRGNAQFFVGRILHLLVLLGRDDRSKDVEIVALRHQIAVLIRQVNRPDLRPQDRVALAALSRMLPKASWPLLRRHRPLVTRRHAAQARTGASSSRQRPPESHGVWRWRFTRTSAYRFSGRIQTGGSISF